MKMRSKNKLKAIILSTLTFCIATSQVFSKQASEVSINYEKKPKIEIALAKENTEVNTDNFENNLKEKLSNLGVDSSDVIVQTIEPITNKITSQTLDVDNITKSWETVGAKTWQSSNGQIVSLTHGGKENPSYWGTALINPKGYDSEMYKSSFTMVTGGQLNEGVCFNVTKNEDGSLNGYFISMSNHTNSSCALFRFDHYTLDQAFDSGINNIMSCGPHNNGWNLGQTYTYENDSYTVLARWESANANVKYDVSYENGDIVIKTNNAQVAKVHDDKYPKGTYGFWGNNCELDSYMHIADIDITTQEKRVKKFEELLRDTKWSDSSQRFITYISDTTNEGIQNELLTRLINEGVHFIGWGNNDNKEELKEIIGLNNNQGIYISNKNYDNAIEKTAKYIQEKISELNKNDYILLNEPIKVSSEPEGILTGTADEEWESGKWRINHDFEYFDNNLGQLANSGKYTSDFISTFDKVGKYDLTYMDKSISPASIYVHRKPVAQFTIERRENTLNYIDKSFDLDKRKDQDNGIEEREWKWLDTSENVWHEGQIEEIDSSKEYIIQLRVKDHQNTWSDPVSKYITSNSNSAPIAMFELENDHVSKYENIEITNTSYDPAGNEITSTKWEVYKEGEKIYEGNTPKLNYITEGLGEYTIYLTVTNSQGVTSEEVSKRFEIINDVLAPEVSFSTSGCEWKQRETVGVKVVDKGGSGFKSFKYTATDTQEEPSSWNEDVTQPEANITLDQDGVQYLHIKTKDIDGNESPDRVVGPFKIDNSNPTIQVSGDLETETTEPINIRIETNDTLSGVKKVSVNGDALPNKDNNVYRVTKNGTYVIKVEDNAGNSYEQNLEVTNVYTRCDTELGHPRYSTSSKDCPICNLIEGVHVTNDVVTYNSQEQGISYENRKDAQLVEYYNGEKAKPVDVGTYQYELKIEYEGTEYQTGIKGQFEIEQKEITVSGLKPQSREYDGTKVIKVTEGNLVGVEQADKESVGFTLPQNGIVDSKNVGSYKVTIPEITLNGDRANNYKIVIPTEELSATISPKTVLKDEQGNPTTEKVRIIGFLGKSRQYNGTNEIELSKGEIVGIEDCDKEKVDYVVPGKATIPDKNVGTYNVTIPEIKLVGEEAQNYVLSQPSGDEVGLNIVPKKITISKIEAKDKVYDGSNAIELTGGELSGVEQTDIDRIKFILVKTGRTPNYDAGEYNVEVPEIKLTGTAAKNYTLEQPKEGDVKVTISKKDITVEGVTAVDRAYNATNEVELRRGNIVGLLEQDEGKVDYILPEKGILSNKNVGTHGVHVPEIKLTGEKAQNYNIIQIKDDEIKVEISKKDITLSEIKAESRQYDGTNVVNILSANLEGVEAPDEKKVKIDLPETGTIPNKNVGNYYVEIEDVLLSESESPNYNLIQPGEEDIPVEIYERELRIEGIKGENRKWNNTDIVNIIPGELKNVINGDDVNITVPRTGTIEDKSSGIHEVTIEPIELYGDDIANYTLIQPSAEDILVSIYRPDKPEFELQPNIISVNGDTNAQEIRYGDEVEIRLNIENRGSGIGYAQKITNIVPEGLMLVENNPVNKQYGWKQNGNKIETQIASKTSENENAIEPTANKEVLLVLEITAKKPLSESLDDLIKVLVTDIEGNPLNIAEIEDSKTPTPEAPETNKKTFTIKRYVYIHKTLKDIKAERMTNEKGEEYAVANLETSEDVKITEGKKEYIAKPRGWSKSKEPDAEIEVKINEEATVTGLERYYLSYEYERQIPYVKADGTVGYLSQHVDMAYDGTKKAGKVTIPTEDTRVPKDLEDDGWEQEKGTGKEEPGNGIEEGKDVWTTDPEHPDDPSKWVDPTDPDTDLDDDETIQPVFKKLVTATRVVYLNQQLEPESKYAYRSIEEDTVVPATFELGTSEEIEINDHIATPKHWKSAGTGESSTEEINELIVKINGVAHLTEDTRYDLIYHYTQKYHYTKPDGSQGEGEQEVEVKPDGTEDKGEVKVPAEDDVVPEDLEKEGWEREKGTGKEEPGNGIEEGHNVWTTDPEHPDDPSKWVDPKDPESGIDPNVPIHPVYKKLVSALRYVYLNQELEPLSKYAYRSVEDSTIVKAKINLGTTESVTVKGFVATPKHWSTDPAPDAEEPIIELNGEVEIAENTAYYMSYHSTREITYIKPDASEGKASQDVDIGYDGKEKGGEVNIPEEDKKVPEDLKKDGWEEEKKPSKEEPTPPSGETPPSSETPPSGGDEDHKVWTTDPENPGDPSKWVDPEDPDNPVDPETPIYPVFKKEMVANRHVYLNQEIDAVKGYAYRSVEGTGITPAEINIGTAEEVKVKGNTAKPRYWSKDSTYDAPEPNPEETVNETSVALEGTVHLTENTDYYMTYLYTEEITYVRPDGSDGKATRDTVVAWDGSEKHFPINITDEGTPDDLKKDGWEENRGDGKDGGSGRDKNGGKDNNGDGIPDSWDTDGDGRDDAWDTDVPPDGNADSWDENHNDKLDDEEDNSKNDHNKRDHNGGRDTNGDGRPDSWDRNGDGKDDSWDKDGDGNADTYDRNWNGELEDEEDYSKHPELQKKDETGGIDTDKDGRPDTWNRDENGGIDTDGDGKPDAWDRDGDGKDDAWDTDEPRDGNADSYDKDGDGKLDDEEDNSKHPEELKGRDENNGRDTNGDGRPDSWDRDGDGKDDSWDKDGDENADTYDRNWNGELEDSEDNSKHPEILKGRDENDGKDTNKDGKPDMWDRNGDGEDDSKDTDGDGNADRWKVDGSEEWTEEDETGYKAWDTNKDGRPDAWDTDGDGNADSYDKNENGKLDPEEDNSKHPEENKGRDENGGKDNDGDAKPDSWDRNGDGKDDSWDKDGDGNADTYDRNWNGELEDSEDNSKHPEELKGRDENNGKDTNKDGKPDIWDRNDDGEDDSKDIDGDGNADRWKVDGSEEWTEEDETGYKAWDTNKDGRPDAWDTDGDGNADSYDKNENGKLDPEEDNSKHPEENKGRDENGGKDNDGDGKPDAWDRNGDGKDDSWDKDGDGNADTYDRNWNGELEDSEDNSKHPEELKGRDENDGKDTNGDGRPDTWDRNGDDKDDSKDSDGDGNADLWKNQENPDETDWKEEDETGYKAWDTNGDGRPDAWDTDGDGNADSWDKDDDNKLDEEEKDPNENGRDENGGRDTDGDGKPDAWDTDGDDKDDSWDTDEPRDGNADSYDKDGDGKLDDEEDNSKHPEELKGRDENNGKDTNGDGRPDRWDRNNDGKDDSWDKDGDGNADTYDRNWNGELEDSEDNSKHPEELKGRDENDGKDTDKDGRPDTWDRNGDDKDDSKDSDGDGNADLWKNQENPDESDWKEEDESGYKAWDTNGDGRPDAWDTNGDGNADSWDKNDNGKLDPEENNSTNGNEGKDPSGAEDKDGDGKPEEWNPTDPTQPKAWDIDDDGKPDSWDTDHDGNADSWDTNGNNILDPEEDNRVHPELEGRDKNNGRDTNEDGRPDAWDRDDDGRDDSWDTDRDGNADSYDRDWNGTFDDDENFSNHPELKAEDENGGKDTNKDGRPDVWDTDGDGKDDAWDTDVPPDGNADSYDKDGDGKLDDDEDNSKHPELDGRDPNGGKDTNKDGKPDTWDTDGDGKDDAWDTDVPPDGNADSYDRDGDGELDDDEDNSKHPDELKGRDQNGGEDTNGDGRPDAWDRNDDGKNDSWDKDGDGNADTYDRNWNGELEDSEDNSKHPDELKGRDENGGKDTNKDGRPDTWDTDGDGKDDAWDTDVPPDGNADSYDKDGDGKLDDDENNSKHPDELKGRDENGGKDTNGDGKPDTWDTDGDGKDDAWDTDVPPDGNADSYDKDGDGELDDEEDNSKHPDELKGRDENGGKDTNGDGRPDTWDRDGDGKDDAWDTDVPPDGNADSYDRDGDGKLDDEEDNSKHPEELKGRDENNGKDTNGDGKPDTWDRDDDGRDDSWDKDGDGNADTYDRNWNGELEDSEDNSKHPEELKGRDENGGRDTNKDGRPDAWDTDGDGEDDAWDTDVPPDGNADKWKDPETGEKKDEDKSGYKAWDIDGDGKPDSWDTDGDGNADSYDTNGNGELDDAEDNSKHPDELKGRDKNGGKDTNKDGKPDTWDIDGDDKDDSWDTDKDGNADSYDRDGDGKLDNNENFSKHPELDAKDPNGGRDTNKDGRPDSWDRNNDGKYDSWDKDGDGNADTYDRNWDGKLEDEEDYTKHPELNARDEHNGKDTNKDGKPDIWDRNHDGTDDSRDTDNNGCADQWKVGGNEDWTNEDETGYRAWDTNKDGKPDAWDTNGDGKADSFDGNENNQLDPEEDNSQKESNGFEEGDDIYTTDPDHPEDQSKWVDPRDPDAEIDPSQKLYPVYKKNISVTRYIYPDNAEKYPRLTATIYSCKKDWKTTIISSHTFNLGTTENITVDGVNGTPYKWVEDISILNNINEGEDIEGIELNGEITTKENKEYYMVYKLEGKDIYVGPNNENKNVDNVDPEIKFDPHGNSTYAKEQKVTINVTDNKELDTSSFKYKWVQGANTPEPTEEEFTQSFTNGEPITQDGITGTDWYLWAMAKDVNGNKKVARTDAFFFDNTAPTTTKPTVTDTKVNEITVETKQADYESGLNPLLHQYAIKEASSEEWQEWKTAQNESYTFTDLKHSTEYNIKTRATDSVGNSSDSEVITVYTVGLAKPSIQFNPEHWTNGEVEVTISYPELEGVSLTKQYSYNGSDWSTYEEPIKVQSNNTKIYARSIGLNNLGEDVVAERTVTNIDPTKPNIKGVNTTNLQSDGTIHLTADVEDPDSGIIAYQFSQNDSLEYNSPDGWVPVENKPEVGGITEEMHLSRNVIETGMWYLYVKDDAGNLAKGQVEVTESAYDVMTPVITYQPIEWYFVKDAQIDYPEIEGMQIFYGINNQDDMRPYTRQTPLTININNTVIYAKTVINGKERFVSKTVEKIDTIAPTGNIEASKITTHNITVTVNANDEGGSGLRDSDTYTYYINGQREVTTTDNSYTFDDLSQSSEYTLKVVIKDNAGNESEKETTVSTKTVPSLSSGGNIKFEYDPGDGWTNTDVTVKMTTENVDREEFTLQYLRATGQEDWEDYTDEGVIMQQNGAIYARLVDETGQTAGTATGNVGNIDKVDPEAVFMAGLTNTHSIQVEVLATDEGGSELRDEDTYAYYKNNILMTKTTESTYTFENLQQNTDFNLKVEIYDNAGNKITREITQKTETVPGLTMGSNIKMDYTPKGWTATDVEVVLLEYAQPGYTLEYSKGLDGNWYEYNPAQAINVERNGAIHARLVDETGQIGGIATGNITNIDKDKPTATLSQNHDTSSVTINVDASDGNGSGLADESTYKYYKEGVLINTSTRASYTFTQLSDYTQYNFKVEITDNVGNMETKTLTQRTQCTGTHSYCDSYSKYNDYYCSVCTQHTNTKHYVCSQSAHRQTSHQTSSGGSCPYVTSWSNPYYYCSVHNTTYSSSGTCKYVLSTQSAYYYCTKHPSTHYNSSGRCSVVTQSAYKYCTTHPSTHYSTSATTCTEKTTYTNAYAENWTFYNYSGTQKCQGSGNGQSCYHGVPTATCYLQYTCSACGLNKTIKYMCNGCHTDWLNSNKSNQKQLWSHECKKTCGKTLTTKAAVLCNTQYTYQPKVTNYCDRKLLYQASIPTYCSRSITTSSSVEDTHYIPCAAHSKTYAHYYCSHNSNGVPHD